MCIDEIRKAICCGADEPAAAAPVRNVTMSVEQEAYTVREAVGVFNHPEDLQGAIDELLSSGFDRAELSLLASEHEVEQKLGHRYEKVSSLADDPTIPRAAYVSSEAIGGAEGGLIGGLMYVGAAATAGAIVASGGTLATAIAATALAGGAGGLIGSILAKWVGDHHAGYLQEQMNHGGLLLWVRTWAAEDEKRAVGILKKHSANGAHVHTLPMTDYSARMGSAACGVPGPRHGENGEATAAAYAVKAR